MNLDIGTINTLLDRFAHDSLDEAQERLNKHVEGLVAEPGHFGVTEEVTRRVDKILFWVRNVSCENGEPKAGTDSLVELVMLFGKAVIPTDLFGEPDPSEGIAIAINYIVRSGLRNFCSQQQPSPSL